LHNMLAFSGGTGGGRLGWLSDQVGCGWWVGGCACVRVCVCVYMCVCVREDKLFIECTDTPMLVFSGSTGGGRLGWLSDQVGCG